MTVSKFQRTINQSFTLEGIGLHSGKKVTATVSPAPVNAGITINGVAAIASNVTSTKRATTIGGVALVEHLLSAAAGLDLDNLTVTVKGPELPALDGSSLPWVEALAKAGLVELGTERNYLAVRQPIRLTSGESSLEAWPDHGFKLDFMVKFEGIGEQFLSFDAEKQSYSREIAPARTFGYLEEYEELKAKGLALGASTNNALILSREGYRNEPRFPDELVRHKVLDLIGDLALLGRPLRARIKAIRSGHQLNAELVRRLTNG
jgi:UDP-3-O-[3-hydroxymyristoyl] N-acetylglucosamine deacetylase